MDNISSIDLLPTNDRDKELFKAITPPLDRAINTNVIPIINSIESMYDPSSIDYDPDKIISLLGSKTLINLLSPLVDKASLSIVLTDLMDMKGTLEGFETLLRLLNIKYKQILFTAQPSGCTDVIIVFANGQRINLSTIYSLQQFANELFPLCLTLQGISNCSSLISPYTSGPINLGEHLLDIDFILDQSKTDLSYGIALGTSGLSVLICNSTTSDLNSTVLSSIDSMIVHSTLTDLILSSSINNLLDLTLTLDYQDLTQYNTFIASESSSRITDLLYSDYYLDSSYYTLSAYMFRLDSSLLDGSTSEPLDTILPTVLVTNSLDNTLILDGTKLGSSVTTSYINIYNTRVTISDFSITCTLSGPTSLSRIVGGIGLDYTYEIDSQYLPLFN